jgi:hypothetical protein
MPVDAKGLIYQLLLYLRQHRKRLPQSFRALKHINPLVQRIHNYLRSPLILYNILSSPSSRQQRKRHAMSSEGVKPTLLIRTRT